MSIEEIIKNAINDMMVHFPDLHIQCMQLCKENGIIRNDKLHVRMYQYKDDFYSASDTERLLRLLVGRLRYSGYYVTAVTKDCRHKSNECYDIDGKQIAVFIHFNIMLGDNMEILLHC